VWGIEKARIPTNLNAPDSTSPSSGGLLVSVTASAKSFGNSSKSRCTIVALPTPSQPANTSAGGNIASLASLMARLISFTSFCERAGEGLRVGC